MRARALGRDALLFHAERVAQDIDADRRCEPDARRARCVDTAGERIYGNAARVGDDAQLTPERFFKRDAGAMAALFRTMGEGEVQAQCEAIAGGWQNIAVTSKEGDRVTLPLPTPDAEVFSALNKQLNQQDKPVFAVAFRMQDKLREMMDQALEQAQGLQPEQGGAGAAQQQMAMGMMGLFIVHPRDPAFMPVDRDFAFLLAAYDIDPGTYIPRVAEMTDFNMWTWNSRIFPDIDPLVVSKGDRVRVRCGNLTMTNHPIHMHGYDFQVTCTDGGWVPESARWPEVSIDIPVGAMRAYEFNAWHEGDWAIHCHKSHHTMNAMGHDLPTFIGTDKRQLARMIRERQPGYMPMGTAGMADMGMMSMELPDNTVPMMTGWGPYGPLEMGGMFSVVKVREGLAADDFSDPGWYQNPPGTQAWEWTGELPDHASNDSPETRLTPRPGRDKG